jgi:predicted regulator of Ras-like GTPase activity (Roadblock/LC7/MglB family)
MPGLPALNNLDQDEFARVLEQFLLESGALRVFLLERAGYDIARAGQTPELDAQSFAALASNAFNAIDALAESLGETDYKALHQRGGRHQTLIYRVGDSCLLVAIFPSELGIEAIERAAACAATMIEAQLTSAHKRLPSAHIDLADHNPANAADVFFRRKPN